MDFIQRILPFVVMISLECLDVGLTTLSKLAFLSGLSHFVFVVYSNALAAVLLCPFAFFMDNITVMQNCVYTGVNYTSPTLASAMANLIPAFTFILSVIFRLEKVKIRSLVSQAKVLGTLVSVGGAMIVTLYNGPVVRKFWFPSHYSDESHYVAMKTISVKDWIIGSIFLAGASLSWSTWNIMQVATLKRYPAELSIMAFTTTFAAMQSAILTCLAEHNVAVWSLKWGIDVISISYSAIIGTGLTYTLQIWCNGKKGPLFVAMFKPVGIVIAVIASAIFLGDKLHVGSVVGAIFIVLGFYAVIWAHSKDGGTVNSLPSTDPVRCHLNSINDDGTEAQPLLG